MWLWVKPLLCTPMISHELVFVPSKYSHVHLPFFGMVGCLTHELSNKFIQNSYVVVIGCT